MSWYPVIVCIVLGCKKNDDTRITLAVGYPVWDLNPCTIFGSHEGMVDSIYNLIATVNHKPSKKNDGHYMAVNKSPTLGSWYKYDDDIVNLIKFVKGNTNSVLMDFRKTTSILFYVDVRYVSVCYNNLCNDDEVIDHTGHKHPPICQATPCHYRQATTHPDLRHLLGQKRTWTMIVSFCLYLNQQKMARENQVKINVPIMFYPFAIGLCVQCQKVAMINRIKNGV
jgi:hypothetical protein